MKRFMTFIFLISTFSPQVFGKGQLIATPINSPVKETYLKVKLEGLEDISSVYFKPKNGGSESEEKLLIEGSSLVGQLKVGSLKPGSYEYRIRVRTSSGNSIQNEAASVAFISFSIDASLEVPDPGVEGQKTLLGIDSDGDGIRDDVQRYLNETYSNQPNVRMALEQLAKAYQSVFSTVSNKEENIKAIFKQVNAIACLTGIDGRHAPSKGKQLAGRVLNTKERLIVQKKADLNFSGQNIQAPNDLNSTCEFSIK